MGKNHASQYANFGSLHLRYCIFHDYELKSDEAVNFIGFKFIVINLFMNPMSFFVLFI